MANKITPGLNYPTVHRMRPFGATPDIGKIPRHGIFVFVSALLWYRMNKHD